MAATAEGRGTGLGKWEGKLLVAQVWLWDVCVGGGGDWKPGQRGKPPSKHREGQQERRDGDGSGGTHDQRDTGWEELLLKTGEA